MFAVENYVRFLAKTWSWLKHGFEPSRARRLRSIAGKGR